MRHLWIVGAALLAACFTDAGVISTSAGATSDATTAGGATTTTTTATSATTNDTTEPATTTSDSAGTLTGADATTMSLTSGATTTGDATTTSGTTDAPGTSTGSGNDLPVPGCDPLFFTDFSQDPVGALQYAGGGQWSWNPDAGELTVATQTGSSFAWISGANWTDFTAYTRLRFGSGYGLLRGRGQPNGPGYYYTSIATQTQEIRSGISLNGQANPIDAAPTMVEPGVWYTLRLSLLGTKFFADVDGISTSFDDPTFAAGSVAIGGYGSGTVTFDWLLVCAP